MGFRRNTYHHEHWQAIVAKNAALVRMLPPGSLVNEHAFRDYVTSGVHRDVVFSPGVSDLSPEALRDLWDFINVKAMFDMDATLFDNFNQEWRRLCGQGAV